MIPDPQYCAEYARACADAARLARDDANAILGVCVAGAVIATLLGLAVSTARVRHYRGACAFVLAAVTFGAIVLPRFL